MRLVRLAVASGAAIAVACGGSVKPSATKARLVNVTADVLQHHKNSTKDGLYVDPLFTRGAAAKLHRETDFSVDLPGQVYAQPLYVENGPGGMPVVIVATEENVVLAIDASRGAEVWRSVDLDPPAMSTQLPCGNIMPEVGVTGTPVIDLDWRAIYVAANTNDTGVVKQKIYALSIDDGSGLDGWPVDVEATVSYGGVPFISRPQHQRGALLIQNGYLYVPYGGHYGDCGQYRGWVVAVPQSDPSSPSAFATDITGGGIWAPAGLSSDGLAIFASTGNTFNATSWMGGEAVFRLGDGATFSGDVADHFYPSNWLPLDRADADISGVAPVLVDVPDANPSALAVLTSKRGVTYVLDRNYLGGMGTGDGIHGEGLFSDQLIGSTVINAPAAFTTANGTYVAMASINNGVGCPKPGNLVVYQITPTTPPTASVVWCASVSFSGRYGQIVTTPDGVSEPVLWTISANRLRAFDAETGEVLFDGGGPDDAMAGVLRNFIAPIAVNGRIFVAGDNQLYAFTTQ